jgi:hypothetical protein
MKSSYFKNRQGETMGKAKRQKVVIALPMGNPQGAM